MFRFTRGFWVLSLFVLLSSLVSLVAIVGVAQAGGGPENVFLVVNPKSADSMTVANHYIRLRDIPGRNVLYLDWNPETNLTDVDTFRTKILGPVLQAICDRGLIDQVDYVVYSIDYPWGIELKPDIDRFLENAKKQRPAGSAPATWPEILGPRGSLTSLTYLYQYVLTEQPVYTGLTANHYMRIMKENEQTVPTIGFSNRLRFDEAGKPTQEMTGVKYMLSVALGVNDKNGRRGNSVEEILRYLERSVKADATFPRGTIYFDDHDDVRCRVRKPLYPAAIQALAQLGIKGSIVQTFPPKEARDIMGLTLGSAKINLDPWREGIRPGALCDNLTSHGGTMVGKTYQTPLTDFLRLGMAGASGTVLEPMSFPPKFPSPMLHVHYARGCSMAEAFYQSVHGPYQLLIVGEPLCKPWADVPQVSIEMRAANSTNPPNQPGLPNPSPQVLSPQETISGKFTLHPTSQDRRNLKAHHFEIYIDGHLVGVCLHGGEIPVNSARLGDGYHELRVVAVSPQPIYTRGHKIVWIKTSNAGRGIDVEYEPLEKVPFGDPIVIKAKCTGAKQIDVEHNGRTVAKIEGDAGQVKIDTNQLGQGPVLLQVIGILDKGTKNRVFSRPIAIEVSEPAPSQKPEQAETGL